MLVLAIAAIRDSLSRFTANTANVESKEGRLIIFPSWLRHSVPANQDESERISISFDLMFKDFTETMAKSKVGFTAIPLD